MKKKIIASTLILLLNLIFITNSFAANAKFSEINKSLNIEQIEDDKDKDKVSDIFNENLKNIGKISKNLNWTKVPAKNGETYKVYMFKDNIKKYYETKSFNKLISNSNVYWETPLLSEDSNVISTMRAYKNNDSKWGTSEGHGMPIELINFYIEPANIQKILLINGITNPESVKHIRIRHLYMDFFFVKDGNNEFAIPLANNPEELGLKNFTLYKMSDFIDTISTKYVDPEDEKDYDPNSNALYGGSKSNVIDYSPFFIAAISILFILLAVVIYIRKKRFCRD